jgi:hypothetical protein
MVACELYNSIAQMMIMKHKQAMVARLNLIWRGRFHLLFAKRTKELLLN